MEAVVETEKRAGRNRQLTERDRELCGFLAVCRYLTREQIERLMFPGRSKARSSTRLRQLASGMGGPGGGGTRRPGVCERGRMDDGLGFDGGRVRHRFAALEPQAGENTEARRRPLVPQARGDAERGAPRPRAAARKDAGEGAQGVPLGTGRIPRSAIQ